MTALCVAVLAVLVFYVGAIGAAFATIMRLSLRLVAERTGRSPHLGPYLDDPVRLFRPVRASLGLLHVLLALCLADAIGVATLEQAAGVVLSALALVAVFEHLLPFVVVRKDPERVLELLLPSFDVVVRACSLLGAPFRLLRRRRPDRPAVAERDADLGRDEAAASYRDASEPDGIIEGDERRLLQSIVDFGDTFVREVMTPRPDIVAIRSTATLAELRAFFREQEYSRIPVYADSLDNIIGFVFIKDLMRLPPDQPADTLVATLVRAAHVVPETKRVADLLGEFQRRQLQIAIVVDEYGGTAGLVTLEDLLEEIVGEIRDEYDVETEPVVAEPDGGYLVAGNADVLDVARRLGLEIEPEGFETFGGYVLSRLGRVPAAGEVLDVDGHRIEILDAERRRVHRLRVLPPGPGAAAASTPAARTAGESP